MKPDQERLNEQNQIERARRIAEEEKDAKDGYGALSRGFLLLARQLTEAERALRQIAKGEPEPTDADIKEGIYPMLNRTHEVHLYQRIAQRALGGSGEEAGGA